MTQAAQTANPNDARQASMSRVSTQETVLEKLNPPEPAKVAPDGKPEGEQDKDGEGKPKKSAQERIQELATKRREAEEKAEAAERKVRELEARVQAQAANAKPIEASDRPIRSQFTSEEEYIEALTDHKAREAVRKREAEQEQARLEAEQAEIVDQFNKRQQKAMKEIPDYAEVMANADINLPSHVFQTLLELDMGPYVGFYLALHPEEAKRVSKMRPIQAVRRLESISRDLADIERADAQPGSSEKDKPAVQKSKAPPPIEPVKSAASGSSSGTTDYESYRARRKAEQRK